MAKRKFLDAQPVPMDGTVNIPTEDGITYNVDCDEGMVYTVLMYREGAQYPEEVNDENLIDDIKEYLEKVDF